MKPYQSNIAFLTEIEEVTKSVDPGSTIDWFQFEQEIQINKQAQVQKSQTAKTPTHANHAHAPSTPPAHQQISSNLSPKSHPILQQQKPAESPNKPESIQPTQSATPTLDDFEMNLGESEVIDEKKDEDLEEVVKMEVAEENDESTEEIEEIGLQDNFIEGPSSSSGTSGIQMTVFNVETKTESADIRLGFIQFHICSISPELIIVGSSG